VGLTHPPVQWVPGAVSAEVKQQECQADGYPLSSSEFKNGGAVPALPHFFIAWSTGTVGPLLLFAHLLLGSNRKGTHNLQLYKRWKIYGTGEQLAVFQGGICFVKIIISIIRSSPSSLGRARLAQYSE
jgi:hypothetical protein